MQALHFHLRTYHASRYSSPHYQVQTCMVHPAYAFPSFVQLISCIMIPSMQLGWLAYTPDRKLASVHTVQGIHRVPNPKKGILMGFCSKQDHACAGLRSARKRQKVQDHVFPHHRRKPTLHAAITQAQSTIVLVIPELHIGPEPMNPMQ